MTPLQPAPDQVPPDMVGLRVLVVEDTLLVADMLTEALQEFGAEVIGPAPRVASAMLLVQSERLDGALLDINLAGEYCFPIARALAARAVPFLFLTGYGDSAIVPPEFQDVPRLGRPVDLTTLISLAAQRFRSSACPVGSPA